MPRQGGSLGYDPLAGGWHNCLVGKSLAACWGRLGLRPSTKSRSFHAAAFPEPRNSPVAPAPAIPFARDKGPPLVLAPGLLRGFVCRKLFGPLLLYQRSCSGRIRRPSVREEPCDKAVVGWCRAHWPEFVLAGGRRLGASGCHQNLNFLVYRLGFRHWQA